MLPIGGLKQKVLAAHAAGLSDAIVPLRNQHDLDDVPAEVRKRMHFHVVASVDEVLAIALEPIAVAKAALFGRPSTACRFDSRSSRSGR